MIDIHKLENIQKSIGNQSEMKRKLFGSKTEVIQKLNKNETLLKKYDIIITKF